MNECTIYRERERERMRERPSTRVKREISWAEFWDTKFEAFVWCQGQDIEDLITYESDAQWTVPIGDKSWK